MVYDGAASDRSDRCSEHDVAQVVHVVVQPRRRDVRRDEISQYCLPPPQVTLDDRRSRKRDRGVPGWKRLPIAAVGPESAHRELERLDHHLRQDLRLQEIHPQVRNLRLVAPTSEGIRAERQRNLLRRGAQVLARREHSVHTALVALPLRIEPLIGRVHGQRERSADRRDIDILHLGQMLDVLPEIADDRMNARALRRRRLLLVGLLLLWFSRRSRRSLCLCWNQQSECNNGGQEHQTLLALKGPTASSSAAAVAMSTPTIVESAPTFASINTGPVANTAVAKKRPNVKALDAAIATTTSSRQPTPCGSRRPSATDTPTAASIPAGRPTSAPTVTAQAPRSTPWMTTPAFTNANRNRMSCTGIQSACSM